MIRMVKRLLYIFYFILFAKFAQAACPQIYDYLGNLSSRPYFVSCTGAASYNMNFSSNSNWGAYTINWGDGTSDNIGGAYAANTLINHTYNSASPDTFLITLTIPSQNCTLTGVAVMEKPVNASIQIPIGGVTTACAPKALQFINSSTDVSETTVFTWNFGDGSPTQTFNYTNAGQTITHTYNKNTVNCQTAVTLNAKNYCTPAPTIANFNPIQIYDIDDAAITSSSLIKCWPDNVFTYTNTTNRNCVPQGNTFQRQEKWNLGNYWGLGHDSIIGWRPWPPTSPVAVAYPAVGNYTLQLLDSNLCGVDVQNLTVIIVNPPTSGLAAPPGPFCTGAAITFTNTSATGYSYKWNFGAGGGFVSKPFGPQTYTYNTAGTYTVSLIALVSGGGAACTDTEKVVVTILPRPVANFSATPNVGCNQITNATFTDNSTGAVAWNWNFGNGNTFNGLTPPAQNYNTTGNFVASLTVTAANTCTRSFTVPIIVYQKPIALFSPTVACEGSVTSFTDISTFAAGNPITSWNWDFGDASPTATTSTQNPSHTFATNNTFSVQLIVNTANCGDTIVQPIAVHLKPIANFSLTPLNGCPTLTVNFTNLSSNASSYNWNFGNGNNSALTDVTEIFTNTLAINKEYTVTLTSVTNLGCTDTKTATVNVFAKPSASFTVDAPAGCSPVIATFTNNSTGATSFQWYFGDSNSSTSVSSIVTHSYINSSLLIQTYTAQLIATNGNGCKDSTNITVTAYPRPTFNFTMIPSSGCTPLSINFPPVLGAVNYQWDFGDGSPLNMSANPTHVFTNTTTASKTYTVELIATNAFSCVDTAYGYPVVFPKPTSNFTMSPTTACSPVNASFNNTSSAATTYTWNYGDGSPISTFSNSPHTYTNTSLVSQTFTVELITGNAFSCTDTSYFYPVILPKPNAVFSNTPSSGCSPLLVNFNNSSTGATTYTWNFGDTTPTSNNINTTHNFTNTTLANLTRTVNLVIENSFNCTDTAYTTIIISPKPVSNFTMSPGTACAPVNASFNNTSSAATSYTWNYGDGSPASTLNNPPHTFTNTSLVSQTFTVELIASNAFSCTDTSYFYPVILPKPNAVFSNTPNSGCSPLLVSFNNSSTGATTYTWNYGDTTPTDNNINTTHSYTNTTLANLTRTVNLVIENSFSCKDTAYTAITISPKPNVSFTNSVNSGCSPTIVTFTNNTTGATSYTWNYSDGSATTHLLNTSHSFSTGLVTNQVYTVQLSANNAFDCKDSARVLITVSPKPSASFNYSPTAGCSPLPINYTNTSVGATTYTWSYGDGTSLSNNHSPSHTYTNSTSSNTTFVTQLVVENTFACKDTVKAFPQVFFRAIPDFTMDVNNGCSPVTVNFTNTSSQSFAYLWKLGNGSTSSETNITTIYYNNGATNLTYSCSLKAYTFNGCSDSITKTINVFNKPIANFNVDTPSCSPKILNFSNTSVGGASYLWNFGTTTSTSINATHQYINSTSATQTQTVQLIATSSNNCKDTIISPIYVHPKPEFMIVANPDNGCTPLSVNFPNIAGVKSYKWNFGNNIIDSVGNTSTIYKNFDDVDLTYTVQLIGTNVYGCKDTSTKTITVFPKPTAKFVANPNTVFIPGTPVNCTNLSADVSNFLWNFGDNTTSSEFEPSHFYTEPGEYQIYLIAISNRGCKDTFELSSKIIAILESDIDVPNAFTPNPNGGNGGFFDDKDTNNDVFHPVIKGVDKYELNIFSRWGELLFVSTDVKIGWDGYYKGKLCTQDVYIWKIDATTIDGKKLNKTGDLLLLR